MPFHYIVPSPSTTLVKMFEIYLFEFFSNLDFHIPDFKNLHVVITDYPNKQQSVIIRYFNRGHRQLIITLHLQNGFIEKREEILI